MYSLKNIKFILLIVAIISLFSCQPERNPIPANATYTIDSIYITMSRDTGNKYFSALWIYNNRLPLRNIEIYESGDTIIYNDSLSGFPGLVGNLVSKTTCVNNVVKSMYTSESGFSVEKLGNVIFFNQDKLDSIIYNDLTFNWTNPFIPLKKTFIPTYTNNNLDSLPVNVSSDGYLTLSDTRYGNFLYFNYTTLNNQKQLIGLDVNEFLYIQKFFTKLLTNYSLFPYGQHLMMMTDNHTTINTNCKNLLSEIHSQNKQEYISYTFDTENQNRIKEINVQTITTSDQYNTTYQFHYKP